MAFAISNPLNADLRVNYEFYEFDCGSGAHAEELHCRYPQAKIIGVVWDTRIIGFVI